MNYTEKGIMPGSCTFCKFATMAEEIEKLRQPPPLKDKTTFRGGLRKDVRKLKNFIDRLKAEKIKIDSGGGGLTGTAWRGAEKAVTGPWKLLKKLLNKTYRKNPIVHSALLPTATDNGGYNGPYLTNKDRYDYAVIPKSEM